MMTEDPATQWNRQEIIKKLVELEHNQKILSPRVIRHSNPALYCAVFRNFGCWSSALAAAGIRSPRAPRKKKRRTKSICWTKETIIEMILECAVKRQPMLSSKIRPVSLRNAAIKTFGSWAEAVRRRGREFSRRVSSCVGVPGSDLPQRRNCSEAKAVAEGAAEVPSDPQRPDHDGTPRLARPAIR